MLNRRRHALIVPTGISVLSPWHFMGYILPFFEPGLSGNRSILSDPWPLDRFITMTPYALSFLTRILYLSGVARNGLILHGRY